MIFRCVTICLLSCVLLALGGLRPAGDAGAVGAQENPPPAGEVTGETSETSRKMTPAEQVEYHQLLRLFVDTLDQVERNYAQQVDRRELMEAAIDGLLSKLDNYSQYIAPDELDEFQKNVTNKFGGIGIQLGGQPGRLMIISPLVGTPAYRAGVLAGDRIMAIDGESTKGLSLGGAVKRLKGAPGTEVSLTVLHRGQGRPVTVKLRREVVRIDTVLGDHRGENDSWEFICDAEAKIGYVRIAAFSGQTASDLRDVLRQLQEDGMRGFVLDLRFNPGGLLSAAVEVSDLFLDDGLIVSTEGRNVAKQSWHATQKGTFDRFPMAVLVNRYSASASEIVAACLQDHERAVIIGERTYGKGSVQQVVDLEAGRSALKLTTGSYHRPNGKNIHRFQGASDSDDWGVQPNSGMQIRLNNLELGRLFQSWRARDIIQPHSTTTSDNPPASEEAEDTEATDDSQDREDRADDEDQTEGDDRDTPAAIPDGKDDENGSEETPAEDVDDGQEDADEDTDQREENVDDQAEPGEGTDAGEENVDDQAEPGEAPTEFIDRQLQKALDYVKEQLSAAHEETSA